jgi:DNA-directed RNA polymerase II subunit RPB2
MNKNNLLSDNIMTTNNKSIDNETLTTLTTLTTKDIFRVTDLYFYKKDNAYRHLYDSYNKFLEEDVKNFLERTDHIFNEKMTANIFYRRKFRFKNVRVIGPKLENNIEPMFPSDARHKNLTYSIKLVADVSQHQEKIHIISDNITEEITGTEELDVPIGIIPLMVKSKYCSLNQYKGVDKTECDYNPGGYFVVNGSEKVVICQDRMVENKPLVFLKKDSGTMSYIVQVNSRSYKPNGMIQILNIKARKDGLMTIRVPILNEVNVFALFRALGVESDKDIIDMIIDDPTDYDMIDVIRVSLDHCKNEANIRIQTEEEAYDYLINKLKVLRRYTETNKDVKVLQKKLHLKTLLNRSFIPHIEGSLKEKAYYLGYMINKLLKVFMGRENVDDRDSYVNKRVDNVGDLMMELFRQKFKIMMSDCNNFFLKRNDNDEKPVNIINQIKPNTIEQGMKASLSTGAWIRKKGVAQMLQRYTFLQTQAFLRRVDTPGGDASSSKLTSPRMLHPSSVGFLCIIQTPEHAKVGLTKHLSVIGSITIMSEDQFNLLKEITRKNVKNLLDVTPSQIRNMFKVFLNGDWYGVTDNPNEFVGLINDLRLNGSLDKHNISVVPNYKAYEIKIYCDSGRFCRPVIRVTDNELQLKLDYIKHISLDKTDKTKITDWNDFLNKYPNAIDYIDSEGQPFLMIAPNRNDVYDMKKLELDSLNHVKDIENKQSINRYNNMFFQRYTHCEFHESLLLGEISTCIPFQNRNAGARSIFTYAQSRQAMGMYATNYRDRSDISYILYHLQKPLITTRGSKYIGSEILPSGENCMVAIACYTGYNQEDSLVFNKSSIERGLFRSITIKRSLSIAQKNQSTAQDDIFMRPDPDKVIGMRHTSYEKLNEHGYVPEEIEVVNGDIIIGKVTPLQDPIGNKQYKDSSDVYKSHAPAVIDRVYTGIQNQDGYEIRKVVLRSERTPKVGDKYCLPVDNFDVLTERGWVKFVDVTLEDKIASLVNNNELTYVKPIGLYTFNYNGKMYKVRSQQVDLDVTFDHQMYVKLRNKKEYELINASKVIGKRYKFKKNCDIYNKAEVKTINIDGNDVEYDAFLDLLGIFIADGCIHKNKIYLAGEKERKINHIINVANRLKVKLKLEHKDESHLNNLGLGCNHYVTSDTLLKILEPLNVGVLNKYLPDYVFELNQRQSKVLLESLISCDGSINKQGAMNYYTSSKRLADDVMKLALHSGWSGSIKINRECGSEYNIKGDKGIINADTLCVRINRTKNQPQMNHSHINTQDGQSEEVYDFNGLVGCLEVPSHVFMIRQNNKCVWIGNCCYTDDHDILTTSGWVNVADVTLEHKVASLIDGKRLEYKNPTELQSYDINEDVYVVDSNQVSLKVTKNHRMYIADRAGKKFKIDLAENIYGKQRKYKKNISEYIPENPMNVFKLPAYKEQPEKDLNMDAWLSFFGMWMAEGCCDKKHCVQFAAHKQRVKDELTRICEILGYNDIRKYKFHPEDLIEHNWSIRDKQLTDYFTPLSVGAVNKKLPEWVWNLNTDQCRILIHGMMLGDGCDSSIDELNHKNYSENNFFGHDMDNGTRRYDTSSTVLADQFQRLCLHAGFSTNKKLKCEAGYEAVGKTGKNEGVVFKTSVDAWRLTIIETQNEPLVNKTVSAGKQLDRYENYNGRVYCCTVPTTDGVIYVRRNGMPVWCGNSRYGQKGTCGILLEGQDMPFNKYGIRPDIILNPNAIPKRQTIGQLDECLLSKVCALDCYDGDGTSFEPYDFKKVEKRLEELGYDSKGYEELVNGMTGQKLNVNIFFGPTYYQRLKHMVLDKIHCVKEGTEVLTIYGWKPIENITIDDKVATLDNNELKYENPTEVMKYPDYEGPMYYIKNQTIDLAVTGNHRMWVCDDNTNNYKFMKADDLVGKNIKYKKDCKYDISDQEVNEFNTLINHNNIFMTTCENADRIQQLALHIGYSCILTKYNDLIEVNIIKNNINNFIHDDITTEEQLINEKCPVYCISVPSEVFYVRRNGKAVWTGNSRSRGPRTMYTRQPPEGRTRDGGLRCGEMERDAIIAHGISKFLHEKMMYNSDAYATYVCDLCGLFAQRAIRKENTKEPSSTDTYYCPSCNNCNKISKVIIPYAFKLLIQILLAMNIAPRIKTLETQY